MSNNQEKPLKNSFHTSERAPTTLSQLAKTKSVLMQDKTNFIIQKITLSSETLNDQLKIYEWRNSIEKGIVKCLWTGIFPLEKKQLILETKRKYFPLNLGSLNKMSLSWLIYILKDVLVGFQILYCKFGGFIVQESMINFNENFQVQVWGCRELCSNNFQLKNMNEHEFLCSILTILQGHKIKTNLNNQFYQGLLRFDLLNFQLLKNYVDSFIKTHQLIIPTNHFMKQAFFTFERRKQSPKSPLENSQLMQKDSPKEQHIFSSESTKDFNLVFSPSKKTQRKRVNGLNAKSENLLKESDMTTQDQQDKNHPNRLTLSPKVQEEKERKNQSKSSCNISSQKQQIGQKMNFSLNFRSEKQKTKQNHQKRKFSMQNISFQQQFGKNQPKEQTIKTNNEWKSYGCRMTQSIMQQQNQEINNINECSQIKQESQRHQEEQMFLQFRKFRQQFSFFNCIDDLAKQKQMTNSIKIGPQIRKQQSVNLQKLGKFKLQMHQSIISEEQNTLYPSYEEY